MNRKQAELIRGLCERAYPIEQMRSTASVVSDGKDGIAELIDARDALDEYIKTQRVRDALDTLGHFTPGEIREACEMLKARGKI